MSIHESIRGYNKNLIAGFCTYRNQIRNPQEKFDDAQKAILSIIQALNGLVDENRVIQAIGNAKSPNAVSRALRSRLSFRKI